MLYICDGASLFDWLGNVVLSSYVQKGRLDRCKNFSSLSNLSILDVTIITSGQPPVFAYAQFLCTELTGELLYDPFWEAVMRIEYCGLKVFYIVCVHTLAIMPAIQVLGATLDGNAVNRRLMKTHDCG